MMRAMGIQPSQLRGITGAIARARIETTTEPVERIAEVVGFGDAENMRRAFTEFTDSRLNRSGAQLG